MDSQPLLYNPGQNPRIQREIRDGLLAPRLPNLEVQYPEVFEEQGRGLVIEYAKIMRRQYGTLILIALMGLAVALAVTLPQTPIYQARGSVEIQNVNDNFLNLRNLSPTANDVNSNAPGSDLNTQAKILQSDSVLERVIASLNLGEKLYPVGGSGRFAELRRALGYPEGKQNPTPEQILALVSKNLKVTTEPNTRLVEIHYDSADPQLAAAVVNALTTEFAQQNLESRWKTAQTTGESLKKQMEDVKVKLEKSEDDLQSYANETGLLFTSEKDNVAEEKLRQLQGELSKAQADRVAAQSKYELATTAPPESLPQVLDDQTLKEYQVKLTDLRRQLAEMTSSLTPSHPEVKRIQVQVNTLESALERERTNVVRRIQNEYESSQNTERQLKASYGLQARLVTDEGDKVAHYNILKHEVDTNRQLYDSLLQNVQQASMNSALGASNIRVVDSASVPTRPYKPSLLLNSSIGLFAGAFFGVAFVVTKERANRSIRSPGETELYMDVPELGAIPSASAVKKLRVIYHRNGNGFTGLNSENGTSPSQVELAVSGRTPSVLSDAFRATLTSILYSARNGKRPRVIVITSANPGEGKTTIACNLALALAEIGDSVLLIDSDLRRPRLHQIFGFHNRWGLTDLLKGKSAPNGCEAMVYKTSHRNLSLLPSGTLTSNISAMLHSPRAFDLFYKMREEFDTVIIDSPPMMQMPDARVLARYSDGVVLVVHAAKTVREEAAAMSRRLADDGTRVLGTILNQWDPGKSGEYVRAYGYNGNGYHK
jgi:succinoglycan biosynthesis transport protein ExoP